MTNLFDLGRAMACAAVACASAPLPCWGGSRAAGSCEEYPVVLYPDPDAHAKAEAELQGFAPGATMIWHPARGTFWFVTLSVPLPQCGSQADVYAQLLALATAHPDLFQFNLKEWKRPAPYACADVGPLAQVLEVHRARVGSHPISHDLIRFTVQRVNSVVTLQALLGDYLPACTPSLDETLSACPDLDADVARQVVKNSEFDYMILNACNWVGSGTYLPNDLDTIAFSIGANWAWQEDSMLPRVSFTKSTLGRLVVDPANYTPELINSDANCPGDNGPSIGFRVTMDSVTNELAGYLPGLNCVVCFPSDR